MLDSDKAPRLTALATTISGVLGTNLMLAAPASAQDQGLEEITVTGSRIVRRDLDAPSPIMTVDAQRLEQSSTLSIESVLNQMPQFTPAGTQFVSGGQGSPTTSLGIASVNLRGIGTNRTLVLVDGRRPQPINAALVVDLNTIPSAAIERVETITGGASAVYGPDALAGVVNFVLKDDFEGVDVDYQIGAATEGDGQENRFNTLFGVNSADGRANVMVGLEYYDRDVVWQRDREFYKEGWYDPGTNAGGFIFAPGFSFAGSANRPTQAAVNAVWQQYHPGNPIPNVAFGTAGSVNEIYFNRDGSPFVIPGANGYNSGFASTDLGDGYAGMRINRNGNLGQVFEGGMASTPQERRSIFGRARYDITDGLTAFAQLTYSNNSVTTTGGIPPAITVWQATVPDDGRAIPPALQQLLDSRPDDPNQDWRIFRGLDFADEPFTTDNSNDVYQIMAGLEGSFGENDTTWELNASTGSSDSRSDYRYLPSLQRYQTLVRLPNFGVGRNVFGREYVLECATGLPMFGNSANMDPECYDSIDMRGRASSILTQDVVEFNVQGKIADMSAGELRFAAGAAYRDNTFKYEPLNDNRAITDHPVGLFVSDNTYGEMTVREVYGELLVPLTQRLNVELGYRLSEFNTVEEDVDTWKALFDYAITDSTRLRGGFQAATRAPNTAELFQGPIMLTVGFGPSDPCSFTTTAPWGNRADNPNRLAVQNLCYELIGNPNTPFGTPGSTAANTFARPGAPFFPLENVLERGNYPNVQPESADTWTFGIVMTAPGPFENLSASIDMYSIEMTDTISRISPVFVYEQCFNSNGTSNPSMTIAGNPLYCSMIGRQPITGERDTVQAPFLNQGALNTSGVDLAVNWALDFESGSSFTINSVASILNEYELQDAPGLPFLDAKGTLAEGGQYDYRLNTTFGYNFGSGRTNVGLRWNYLPEVKDAAALRPPTNLLGTGSYSLFAAFAGFQISDRMELRGGIDNLLDEEPRIIGANPVGGGATTNAGVTNAQYYDILGRRAYVGLKMRF
jgi:iron complex outermembrane receptor protein